MNRRSFFKRLAVGVGATAGGGGLYLAADRRTHRPTLTHSEGCCEGAATQLFRDEGSLLPENPDARQRAIEKSLNFDVHYADDVIVPPEQMEILRSIANRLSRAQQIIGHGHFNLVSFEQLLDHARLFPKIGELPSREIDFMESVFDRDSRELGFFGEKVLTSLTAHIADKDVKKIAGTGHYLLRGTPLERYEQIRRDVGETITLTSGVRGMVKQFHLFLMKAVEVDGNLSQAARSLAPPGHSHHARGDFDVGKIGLGERNFTEDFAETDEYKRLIDLGYVEIRYEPNNPFGVRHEPWHVKI
ncbi:MAG: M15 family metallopeptidase [Acidobacteriota bacterium]